MTAFVFDRWLAHHRQNIESTLASLLSTDSAIPETLGQAMAYALLDGGKRLRVLLCLATCELFGGDVDQATVAGAAIEMVHAYSLVHDDLPCMDDDILRRGKPTCHVHYGEAVALLVGDALLTQAFEVLTRHLPTLDAAVRCELVALLAISAGSTGMVAGQYLDITSTGQSLDLSSLSRLHCAKTGALIRAAILSGALIAKADAQAFSKMDQIAQNLGLLYQIVDDILDVESSTATLGKTAGKDEAQHKATYVTLLGLTDAKLQRDALFGQVHDDLLPYFPQSEAFLALLHQITYRTA